jgi:hypothetical protein
LVKAEGQVFDAVHFGRRALFEQEIAVGHLPPSPSQSRFSFGFSRYSGCRGFLPTSLSF